MSHTNKDVLNKVYHDFGRLDIHLVENAQFKFFTGILDRFNYLLTLQECEELMILFSTQWKKNAHEKKLYTNIENRFIEIFKEMYRLNKCSVVVISSTDFANKKELKELIKRPYVYQSLELQEYKKLKSWVKHVKITNNGIIINEIDLLLILFKLTLRELILFNFFFSNLSTVLIGNYELNLPIYTKSLDTMNQIKTISNENGLFIRGWEDRYL